MAYLETLISPLLLLIDPHIIFCVCHQLVAQYKKFCETDPFMQSVSMVINLRLLTHCRRLIPRLVSQPLLISLHSDDVTRLIIPWSTHCLSYGIFFSFQTSGSLVASLSTYIYIDGLAKYCSISSVLALDIPQSCSKPLIMSQIRAHFLSLAWRKLRLCSANHRPGYWSNLPCDWPSTAWAYSK